MQPSSPHPSPTGASRPSTPSRSGSPVTARLGGALGILATLVLAAVALLGHALDHDDGAVDGPFVTAIALAAALLLAALCGCCAVAGGGRSCCPRCPPR